MTLRTYLLSHVAYNALEHVFPPMVYPMRIVNEAFTKMVSPEEFDRIFEESFSNAFDNGETLH